MSVLLDCSIDRKAMSQTSVKGQGSKVWPLVIELHCPTCDSRALAPHGAQVCRALAPSFAKAELV